MQPLEIVIVTAITTAAICLIAAVIWRKFANNPGKQKTNSFIEQMKSERQEAKAVLGALDIGIITYGSNGNLLDANNMARKMLYDIPLSFDAFCTLYGEDNGIRAGIFLGSEHVSGVFVSGDRFFRITIHHRETGDDGNKRRAGNIIMVQDITALEKEDKQRKEFVANVSHELKTPLTTIKTWSETLLDWGIAEKSRTNIAKDVKRIYDDSLRMEKLIEDLLLLSALDSTGGYINIETVNLETICRSVVERLKPQAESKKQKIKLHRLSTLPLIYGDIVALERIVTNLISNAIKYTPEGGSISVYVNSIVDDVYVKVVDTGIGINPEYHEQIFHRFYRIDNTGSRQYGGTGLGLPIVRELTLLHRGRAEVNSNLDCGSEFMVLLPSARKLLQETILKLNEGDFAADPCGKKAERDIRTKLNDQGNDTWPPNLTRAEGNSLLTELLKDLGNS